MRDPDKWWTMPGAWWRIPLGVLSFPFLVSLLASGAALDAILHRRGLRLFLLLASLAIVVSLTLTGAVVTLDQVVKPILKAWLR